MNPQPKRPPPHWTSVKKTPTAEVFEYARIAAVSEVGVSVDSGAIEWHLAVVERGRVLRRASDYDCVRAITAFGMQGCREVVVQAEPEIRHFFKPLPSIVISP